MQHSSKILPIFVHFGTEFQSLGNTLIELSTILTSRPALSPRFPPNSSVDKFIHASICSSQGLRTRASSSVTSPSTTTTSAGRSTPSTRRSSSSRDSPTTASARTHSSGPARIRTARQPKAIHSMLRCSKKLVRGCVDPACARFSRPMTSFSNFTSQPSNANEFRNLQARSCPTLSTAATLTTTPRTLPCSAASTAPKT